MPSAWEEYKKKIGVVRPWDILNPSSERSSESEANSRFAICLDCDELIRLTKQCKQCGCVMPLKVKLLKSECPIGKW